MDQPPMGFKELEMGLWKAPKKNEQTEKELFAYQQVFDNVYGECW